MTPSRECSVHLGDFCYIQTVVGNAANSAVDCRGAVSPGWASQWLICTIGTKIFLKLWDHSTLPARLPWNITCNQFSLQPNSPLSAPSFLWCVSEDKWKKQQGIQTAVAMRAAIACVGRTHGARPQQNPQQLDQTQEWMKGPFQGAKEPCWPLGRKKRLQRVYNS